MDGPADIFRRLSGETKALILIHECRLQKLSMADLSALLSQLVSSDLERLGIVELIKRMAPQQGLAGTSLETFVGCLEQADLQSSATPAPIDSTPTIRIQRQASTIAQGPDQAAEEPTFRVRRLAPKAHQDPAPMMPPAPPRPGRMRSFSSKSFPEPHSAAASATQKLQRIGDRKVLIADDDTRIRMIFRKKLEEADYLVDEAPNGGKAWDLLMENRYAVAILDMKMPELHGLEILQRLADGGSSQPVIICSAYEQLEKEFVVSTYPNLRYLVKPVPMEKLIATVNELTR